MLMLATGSCVSSRPHPTQKVAWTNSLGMAFAEVPVGGEKRLVACEEVQEGHIARFRGSQSRPADSESCKPASQVSWTEAVTFCDWLTHQERTAGTIAADQRYRLPTDHEWSCAAGIGHLESPAEGPEAKSNRIPAHFPWGTAWPPPRGAGNLCGRESEEDFPENYIAAYRDAYSGGDVRARASAANVWGIHDLGGNLWEWCSDRFREGTDWRVLRGGSWKSARPETLLTSHRTHDPESYRSDSVGFRCVLAKE